MPDESIKKRMSRAKRRACDDLRSLGYKIVLSDNNPVCLVAYCGSDVRLVKICLDKASSADQENLCRYPSSIVVSREIWIRKAGEQRFDIQKL